MRVDKFPVPLNMTYLPESLILRDKLGNQRVPKVGSLSGTSHLLQVQLLFICIPCYI